MATTLSSPALPARRLDTKPVEHAIKRFLVFLDHYGETSWDHQSYFAGRAGRAAKALYYRQRVLGTLAVSPMILSEAILPSARRLFFQRQRFPIADAHYAMGFAYLARTWNDDNHYKRARHFLKVLEETRSPGFENHGWGYPFHWETRLGTLSAGTPMITTLPYVYEAFRSVYEIDRDPRWLSILRSIADHALEDYRDIVTSDRASTACYTPGSSELSGVINASAYRAFLLTKAGVDFSDERCLATARRNLYFVLDSQNADGSWYYSIDGQRDFVDHFHTCFVLKALAKIEQLAPNADCTQAIERGVDYYTEHLFDENGCPKPFSRRPRLTVYKNELYDYAECLNLATLLAGRFPALDARVPNVLDFEHWQKPDGSFRSRRLLAGWDNVPMHRWAQSQYFCSLAFSLYRQQESSSAS